MADWPTWGRAMRDALYGPRGFYRGQAPAAHFRTSVHASPAFASAILALARACAAGTVVDLGAGRGELLRRLHALDPGLDLVGVDVAARPPELAAGIAWAHELPADLRAVLVVANELLDNVAVEVVEVDDMGVPRLVHVDPASGAERLGATASGADADWLARWWPLVGAEPGTRAEVGRYRDDTWAGAVAAVGSGLLVAADYAHDRAARPPYGSILGYRGGRAVPPVPNGSCDVTAHVALDACAQAGAQAGAGDTMLTTQRSALRSLGVRGQVPPHALARADPGAYARLLAEASSAAELLDPSGLGGFGWLVQGVGRDVPACLRAGPRPGAT